MTSPTPSTPELPATYDATATERALYGRWEAAGVFTPGPAAPGRRTFTMVMPPPNVTAMLHIGHGLNNTVQDVIVRWRRMAGDDALWVPGTDHAGIATQNVVEKQLAKEGKTRFDLGREAFVARTKAFVAETGGVIIEQLRAIGASADWTRTAYTFDADRSRAVREAFVRLYDDGLIYRGHRVIHWCPRCLTSLSDEEAEFHETNAQIYHVAYPVVGEPGRSLVIATTRPETMFADVAVAVHPEDERYADLVGRTVTLPLVGIDIPVIADAYVDRAFGTGALKITPAHDANDFDVGKRHGLAMPVVIDETGLVREVADAAGRVADEYVGKDRFAVRKAFVAALDRAGFLVKTEQHRNSVRRCYRCETVVEPRLSDQWFVKMASLAAPALAAVRDGRVRVLPERWEGVYVNWMENIRDWNISRQLWWGHRIPVFYCDACHWTAALREDPPHCPRCRGAVRQDEDVLATWASSWLWPMSTLGWPDDTADLRRFYPTDVLVTAPEILFFWVARMIMSGMYFDPAHRPPFHTVYLTGTVRDAQGRKMSKSLGNGIDPLDVVARYGADALRWTVVSQMGLGVDLNLDHTDLDKAFAPGRNFATKLWNIGRFLLTSVGDRAVAPLASVDDAQLTRADRWILARLDQAIAECDAALGRSRPDGATWPEAQRNAGLRLNEYAETARRFVWNELADWYVEAVKARLAAGGNDGEVARVVLAHAFDHGLRLLHPIMPFITEEVWQRLPVAKQADFVARAAWPVARASQAGARAGGVAAGIAVRGEFDAVVAAVDAIRSLRSAAGLSSGQRVRAQLVTGQSAPPLVAVLREEAALIGALARADVTLVASHAGGGLREVCDGFDVILPLDNIAPEVRAKEADKAQKEAENLAKQLASLTARLSNESFVARAKPEVVAAERAKEREWTERIARLREKAAALQG
ncbi:MAG: valine--tRNA ligase [Gemmatimonadetes bacterium]|nr:valine--tRNA ligase [Gemmatimonadota bacterium]